MVLAVWQSPALLTPTTTVPSVFALILEISASHGKSMTESDVFMCLVHVQQGHHGMVLTVLQILPVLLGSMVQVVSVLLSLSYVSPLLLGPMGDAVLEGRVLMVLTSRVEAVIHTFLARMAKPGTIASSTACVLRELSGMVTVVLLVLEVKPGNPSSVVSALQDTTSWDLDVRELCSLDVT